MKPHHKSIAIALLCAILTPTLFAGAWFKSCKNKVWDDWPAGIGITYPGNEVVCLPYRDRQVDGTECAGKRFYAGVCSDEFGWSYCDSTQLSGWGEIRDIKGKCTQKSQFYIPCSEQRLADTGVRAKSQCDYKN